MRVMARLGALLGLPLLSACEVSVGGDGIHIGFSVGIGAVILANVLYYKWRREDEPDWVRRLIAFCMGLPFSFLTFLLVEPDPDLAWKRMQSRLDEDDPQLVDRDFQRELELIRRRRRIDPPAADHMEWDEGAQGP